MIPHLPKSFPTGDAADSRRKGYRTLSFESVTHHRRTRGVFMLKNPERMARFDRSDAQRRLRGMSYDQALALFEALWAEAATLDPDFPRRWHGDLESDLAIARAINGLPPNA
jgi:hypothetical protein